MRKWVSHGFSYTSREKLVLLWYCMWSSHSNWDNIDFLAPIGAIMFILHCDAEHGQVNWRINHSSIHLLSKPLIHQGHGDVGSNLTWINVRSWVGHQSITGLTQIRTTIHIHDNRPCRLDSWPHLNAFRLWEETIVPGGNQHRKLHTESAPDGMAVNHWVPHNAYPQWNQNSQSRWTSHEYGENVQNPCSSCSFV